MAGALGMTEQPPPPSGETFGRYRLLEPIGRGGMAEVFKAKSFGVEGFEKVLVIKRILPELAQHHEFVDLFVREAKLAVQLSHANIVQVFDLGRIEPPEGPPAYYIAMEHVAGVDLATVLDHHRKTKRALPLGMAVFVATEVARGLDHAHRRCDDQGRPLGIVHRDISPQNILLSWDGDVKVTDFGIAKAVDTIAKDEHPHDLEAARATGKLAFMSPEQSRSERTDARSDLFSLGVVLYEMITGANPFQAPTPGETIRRISTSEYPPIDLARQDTPPELCAAVGRLLALDPAERFSDAAELAERLLAFGYTSGERYGASDLALALAPLREVKDALELEPASVFDDPPSHVDKTPVEVPRPSIPPASHPSTEAGERREVSVMVLMFGGRDATAQPALLARARDALDRHGAWIEEITPSHVVAVFGLVDTDGRDAEAAVRAALVLVRERQGEVIPSAGVHSGTIHVDDGGIPLQSGRLSSMVACAQSLARVTEGQVALSQGTARLVRRSFVTEPLSPSLRAAAEPGLVVRRALDTGAKEGRFVGRPQELKRLGTILAHATRGGPQLVVLRGETGLGKSRLLGEAKRRLERGHFNVAFYSASCPLNGASIPYSGLSTMLHVLCGTQGDDDPERILEVRPRLRALGLNDEQTTAVLRLLGAPLKARESELQAAVRGSFERMVVSLCNDRLHCFAWDDAHAIDRDTLDALLRITRQARRLRCVFILAQRGEVPPALSKHKRLHVIDLGELGERDTETIVEARLGARSIPAQLLDYVRSAAGGHPLFIDELIRELCDSGAVQVLNGSVTLKAQTHAPAPRTLKNLIADRMSRLQQRERRVLQGLAVLGEPAFTPVLASVLEQTLPSLDRHLTSLETRSLIKRIGPTQVRFASPLYQEIVLDAMAEAAKRELHTRAAATYGETEQPGVGDAAERIAAHLEAAGERKHAVDYYWKSADERLAAGQLEAALRSMQQGLALADPAVREVDQLVTWLDRLSHTVSSVRHAVGLKDVVAPVLRDIDARGDEKQRVMAHIHAARAFGSINLFDEAYESLSHAEPDSLDDPELVRASLATEAQLAARQGMFVRAVRASDRLEAMGDVRDRDTLFTLVLARTMGGQESAAIALLDRMDAEAPAEDAVEQISRDKLRVLSHFNGRDFEATARLAAKLAQSARSVGLRFDTAAALHNLGDACDRLGDHPRAYAAFVESLGLTEQLEHDRLTNLNRMHLCLLDGLRSAEGAEERLKALIRRADGNGWLWDLLEGRFLLARLAAAHGHHQSAREQLAGIIDRAKEQGHHLILHDSEQLLAKLQG